MKFRPCIDIHNGKVKQIVGGSLLDQGDHAEENFVSERDAAWYAGLYQRYRLSGGHIILLNPASSPYYEATREQAVQALKAWPGGLQVGGGITDENAAWFLEQGASHVIVTSYVFRDGKLDEKNLDKLIRTVGKKRLVLDLSCRKKGDHYYIVTDRWQKFTDIRLDSMVLSQLSDCCDEFLIHAVDVEGKANGPELELVELLAKCQDIPVTYAGGIARMEDLEQIRQRGAGRLDFTVGSALSLFGGPLPFETIVHYDKECEQ